MSFDVVTTPDADAQISAIDEWWRAHRLAAPDLFREELGHCFDVLSEAPAIGKRYRRYASIPDTRRVLLRSTHYHVYYVLLSDVVLVLAVWHSHRGQAPRL